jgi:hypothetical protein
MLVSGFSHLIIVETETGTAEIIETVETGTGKEPDAGTAPDRRIALPGLVGRITPISIGLIGTESVIAIPKDMEDVTGTTRGKGGEVEGLIDVVKGLLDTRTLGVAEGFQLQTPIPQGNDPRRHQLRRGSPHRI